MKRRVNRRELLKRSSFAGFGIWVAASGLPAAARSPNDKLNIGIIGVSGRGGANMGGVSGENIAALCDINDNNLAAAAASFPKAEKFNDWRKLVVKKNIDAVVVSTPDHIHALASVAAMKNGKHVYCEKPLGHSVHEAQVMRKTYLAAKVATQMGTQIHAEPNYRRVVELVQGGAIGPVREAHVWCSRVGPGGERPQGKHEVPKHLHWDLWLGPAPERPYHPAYFGGCTVWEQYWDFGNGCLGDMGSHLIDLPFWALELRAPTSAEAAGSHRNNETYPHWLTACWDHPATAKRPAVKLFWYDGVKRPPSPPGHNLQDWGIGVLFVGDKGKIIADYGRKVLLPEADFRDFKLPETIPPSKGHYNEWLHACKTGAPTLCNFDYSGMLIENNLLGAVAFRVGKKIAWDSEAMKAPGCPEADPFIRRPYRPGWEI